MLWWGPYREVAARIMEEAPMAMYTCCNGHILNLCIVSCCRSMSSVRNTFFALQNLYKFNEKSTKRHAVFEKHQKIAKIFSGGTVTLKSLSDTRWVCLVKAMRSLLDNFETTLMTLMRDCTDRPWKWWASQCFVKKYRGFQLCIWLAITQKSKFDTMQLTVKKPLSKQCDLWSCKIS